jgi:hypothetical protein
MHIAPITLADFSAHPDAAGLLAAYALECANEDLPPYNPSREVYDPLEQAGVLHTLAAFEGDNLIGFLVLLVSLNPHYSVLLAVTESWFVAPEHRATGAGLELYRGARGMARGLGAKALYVSAPMGGQLAGVMAGLGARETNRVFCEVLA